MCVAKLMINKSAKMDRNKLLSEFAHATSKLDAMIEAEQQNWSRNST